MDNYAYNTGDQDVDTPVSYYKAATIAELQKAGYKVLNADVVVSGSIVKGTQTVIINVEHDTITVTSDKPAIPQLTRLTQPTLIFQSSQLVLTLTS